MRQYDAVRKLLADSQRITPWAELIAVVKPLYPKISEAGGCRHYRSSGCRGCRFRNYGSSCPTRRPRKCSMTRLRQNCSMRESLVGKKWRNKVCEVVSMSAAAETRTFTSIDCHSMVYWVFVSGSSKDT